VLTGFNTDIKHAERVYHIQTEDRGLSNPVVESLVYVGGEILLSKKSPYADHVKGDQIDEKAVRELMDLQHRRIIEAIRRGRFDAKKPGEELPDLADDTFPSPPGVSPAAVAAVAAILSAPAEPLPGDQQPRPAAPKERSGARPAVGKAAAAPASQRRPSGVSARRPATPASPPAPALDERAVISRPPAADGFVETVVSSHPPSVPAPRPAPPAPPAAPAPRAAIPMPPVASPPPRQASPPTPNPFPSAVAPTVKAAAPPAAPSTAPHPASPSDSAPVVSEAPRKTPAYPSGPRTLDQVIVDYLASEAASERLELSVMAGADFVSDTTVPLTVIASTSLTRKPVAGVQVTVRVVLTGGPPLFLFRGLPGNDGMVKTSCSLPDVGSGSAALIIVGFSPIGSSEKKYLIRRKPT
jgi:hypothetical protein